MDGLADCSEFVEVDPTGRYGRYDEILGKGASKTVYRAFDEFEGIEVAWNQVKLYDFLQSPEDLERLYCEIHLLKTLKHENIMKFYTSWVDTANRNINFVTEMFTSGTLRQYRLKHKRVNIRAVKNWCRQILRGLDYLHSHDPPVIHRDLKCDNIFVNGNQGEVKIGDLGLAAILRKSHAAHCVGTPEFMAPEVYQEAYNELVDIYSFGMCVLEMVTFEYPYSECTHPAQIYKRVISGKKPDSLYKVKDKEVRGFVDKCLVTVSLRLSARELLNDPFLQIEDFDSDLRTLDFGREEDHNHMGHLLRHPYLDYHDLGLFEHHDDEHWGEIDISIKGKANEDGGIFLKLRIADKEGRVRNIYFPFDIENDTALSVATEMVAELDITDQDVIKIAETIDGEIGSLVPEWIANQSLCHDCASNHSSNGYVMGSFSNKHGRFEEITEHHVAESAPNDSSQSDCLHYQEISDQSRSDEEHEKAHQIFPSNSISCDLLSDYESEIQRELRWLKAKYMMEMRGVRHNLGLESKSEDRVNDELEMGSRKSTSLIQKPLEGTDNKLFYSSCCSSSKDCIVTAKSFFCGSLLPPCLHRSTSLPVDAVNL